jgi:hypothetical protein
VVPTSERSLDLLGGLLVAGLIAWVRVAAALSGVDPWSALLLNGVPVAFLGIGYVLGRVLAASAATISLATAVALTVTVVAGAGLGYPNATAAFSVQVLALLMVAWSDASDRGGRLRVAAGAVSVGVVIILLGSLAGIVTGLLVLGARFLLMPGGSSAKRAAASAGFLLVMTAAGQLIVAAKGRAPALAWALSQRRLDLWSDAMDLAATALVVGHGPGTFGVLSPTALSDPDTRPAHSVLLETMAEQGLIGAALLAALVAWGYWRLANRPTRAVLVGIAAWTALWLHSLVDYVADSPMVMLAAGVVLGASVCPSPRAHDPLSWTVDRG